MFLKCILLIIALVVIMFCLDVLLPKLINEFKYRRKIANLRKQRKVFKKKMEELEIK